MQSGFPIFMVNKLRKRFFQLAEGVEKEKDQGVKKEKVHQDLSLKVSMSYII